MDPTERTPESRVNETFARKWHIDRYEVRPVAGADPTIELSYIGIVESEDA
jgi:hypothetical protein